jgi:hypothetical protein
MCRTAQCVASGLLLAAVLCGSASAKPFFVEPDDVPDPRGLTVSGGGLARVEPPRRPSEDSIERAVAAVQPRAERRAMREARRRAVAVARVAGLTLGAVQAVTARLPDTERFGPTRYCHSRRGRRPRLRCTVPPFATASIRVTFATAETTAVAPTGRAIVASGGGSAPVRPRHETSPSIRAALRRAQFAADPGALVVALRRATGAARASRLERGPIFAVAEEPRPPFTQDILSGTFAPGRFCGTIRRFRYRRDPSTGRVRRMRRPSVRRCYTPDVSSVFRVTLVAG